MKKAMLTLVSLLLAIFTFSQAELSGKITEEQGKPLPGASLVLLETGQGTAADGQGFYELKNLENGNFTVLVTFIGYDTASATAQISGSPLTLDFALKPAPILLGEALISATRAGAKAPFTYLNLKKQDIEVRNLGQDIPYLLDATPSVVVTSDAGAGIGYTGIRIRGTDASRINVTLNGIPLNDAESQGVFWVNLPDFSSSTEDIQIQRGVGTSTNGAGAFGGTINLNTSKLNPEPYGEASGSLGSFGTAKATLKFGTGLLGSSKNNQGFTFDGRLSRIDSDGYIDRASVDLKAFFASAAYWGKKQSVRLNVFSGKEVTYQAWNGVPAQYAEVDSLRNFNVSGTEKPGEPYDNEVDDYKQTHVQLLFNQGLGQDWNFNLAGHYTRGIGFFEQYKAYQWLADYNLAAQEPTCDTCQFAHLVRRRWLDNHFFGATWAATWRQPSTQLTFGGAASQYLGDHYGTLFFPTSGRELPPDFRYYDGTGDKLDANVYTKIQQSFTPRLHGFLDLQLRRVDYKMSLQKVVQPNGWQEETWHGDYLFFNPKAGVLHDLSKTATLYASFAVAQKEPNRDDFTESPTGALPKPERLFNTEAGFRTTGRQAAFSVNVYHMAYKDQLVLTGNINDVGAPVRRNVPDSYRLGLELAGNLKLTQSLTFEGNATFSRNKIKNFTEYVDNWDTGEQAVFHRGTTDISFSPNFIAFGKLSYALKKLFGKENQRLEFALSGKHVGSQFMDNTSNKHTKLDAYGVSDFQIQWTMKPPVLKEVIFNFLILNWLDNKYSSNAWTYRFISKSYNPTLGDPYARPENGNFYNLTGFFPQAGGHFLAGLTVKF